MENNKELKYQYCLQTWGGFYNEEHLSVHNEKEGYHYFDTAEERQLFIDKLRSIENQLNATVLMTELSEGYCCDVMVKIHRVVEWEGKRYYSERDMMVNYPFSAAKYHLENKWYPGFNDYPLGEDFDYEKNEVKIIQEWITGAFSDLNED